MKNIVLLISIALTGLTLGQTGLVNGKGGGITDDKAFRTALSVADINQSQTGTSAVATWLARDQFSGTPASHAVGATVTSDISGTLTTYANAGTGPTWQSTNGAFLMRIGSGWCGLKTTATVTHTAGRTGIALIKLIDAKNDQIRIGWCSSSFQSGGYDIVRSGVTLGNVGGAEYNAAKMYAAGSDITGIGFRDFKDGDIIAVAVRLTTSGFEVWMNGGPVAPWGGSVSGSSWICVYTNSAGTISGNLQFAVESRLGQTVVLEMGTTDTFAPDSRQLTTLESDNSNLLTHCSNTLYDSSGNLWATWTLGNGADAAADCVVIVRCRLPDGRWSAKTVIVGPGSGSTRYDAGTLWQSASGVVNVIYNSTTDAWTTGVLRSKTLSIDNSASITQGSAATLSGVTTPLTATYQRVTKITTGAYAGRVLISANNEEQWWSLYSDNDGATWTEGTKYYGINTGTDHGYESAFVEEGPEKTLVAYVRTAVGTSATMPRWVSTTGGATWTMSGTIPVPNPDSRAQAVRLANGNIALIGNDSTTNYVRKNPTIWFLTSGGALLGKTLLAGGWGDGWNYPSIDTRGEMLSVVMPLKASASGFPGRVFFSEQSLSDWSFKPLLREQRLFSKGLAVAGINTDIVEANSVTKMTGFNFSEGNAGRAVIYTAAGGSQYGYGFDNSGLRLFGYSKSWAIGGNGEWQGNGNIKAVIPTYANDAAAGSAGLTTGAFYQVTGTGVLMVKQ